MRLITKDIYYAIRSLLYIAQKPEKMTSVSELVGALNMRRAFLRKILQSLSKNKILKSVKGHGGGFSFNMRPSQVRIINVIDIFRSKEEFINCLLEKNICPYPNDCVLMAKMKDIEKNIYKALETTTIATLLNNIK